VTSVLQKWFPVKYMKDPHGKVKRKERSILDCFVFRAVDQNITIDGMNKVRWEGLRTLLKTIDHVLLS
jgi:hypothetical protein